jgi:hypothetical protein
VRTAASGSDPVRSQLERADVARACRLHKARLQALFEGRDNETVFALHGISRTTTDNEVDPVEWLDRALQELAEETDRAGDPVVFRPLLVHYNPHGVHFVDEIFGAEVFDLDQGREPQPNWQARPLGTPIGTLEKPDLEGSEYLRRARAFALAFAARKLRNVTLCLPTIASVLNIAVNLYGQEILSALLLEPEAARHYLEVIDATLREVHGWFIRTLPPATFQCTSAQGRFQPDGHGQLCGCTCQLVSAGTYADWIGPYDDRLLSAYPGGGLIHLCGAHAQHIPYWSRMGSLRAVQLNDRASEDLELYFTGLSDRQILYVHPCEGMPVSDILSITGGRRVVLVVRELEEAPRVVRGAARLRSGAPAESSLESRSTESQHSQRRSR